MGAPTGCTRKACCAINCSQVTCAFLMRSTFRRISIVGPMISGLPTRNWEEKSAMADDAPEPNPHGSRNNARCRVTTKRQEKRKSEKRAWSACSEFQCRPPSPNQSHKPVVSGADNPQRDGHAQHPQNRLERIHGQKIVHGQVDGAQQHRRRGQNLRVAAARRVPAQSTRSAEFLRRPTTRERIAARASESPNRVARESSDHGDQRGLVHIPPGQMLPAGRVIQFIPKISVAAIPQEMNEAGRRSQNPWQWPGPVRSKLPRATLTSERRIPATGFLLDRQLPSSLGE